jgi:hypothetical protein
LFRILNQIKINVMSDLLTIYFIIGFLFTLICDILSKQIEDNDPFTFPELLGVTFLWPILLIINSRK